MLKDFDLAVRQRLWVVGWFCLQPPQFVGNLLQRFLGNGQIGLGSLSALGKALVFAVSNPEGIAKKIDVGLPPDEWDSPLFLSNDNQFELFLDDARVLFTGDKNKRTAFRATLEKK